MIGFLQGTVLDQQNNTPLSGVQLQVKMSEGNASQTTGDNGEFTFELPVGDNYELTATKNGFEEGTYGPLSVLDNNPTVITIALQPTSIG